MWATVSAALEEKYRTLEESAGWYKESAFEARLTTCDVATQVSGCNLR